MNWLNEESDNPNECKVVTNVRCLSEGVDVPSLDAVMFLSARNSQVDVVQSVGRVMRNFRKGQEGEKKYGYIIIPIVVPTNVKAEDALNKNDYFDVVWSILNALRSHDDRFEAKVQQINLNKKKNESGILFSRGGFNTGDKGAGEDRENLLPDDDEVVRQLTMDFGELKQGIYAKLVEKCGDRLYWENWSKEVGKIARKFIERITVLIQSGKHKSEFENYLKSLQKNINPEVDVEQAIEMLAQHMITRPVFDALFARYEFVKNNPVSRSMEEMINLLREEAFEKDTDSLEKFYLSVKTTVGDIDNLEGKQTIIKNLYEKFFKGAFPKTVEKLGIVYTPVECVDFILHSVEDILKKEFNTGLTEQNVHILDPFTGTGTFITRLLQSNLIKPEDMDRKYLEEIHCNEIVLLAYYIADVNIESVFHELTRRETYLRYDGICLTDTFQLAESRNELFSEVFQENCERVNKQKKAPVRVIIGNPPYSAGQKSANDNAQNIKYPNLDARVEETYVKNGTAGLSKALYDTYVKAFRWASDRIPADEGGVVAFISNGAWLDGNAQDGMRKCFEEEFSSIYVLNLRGNQRTSGELSRKEGGKIFGSGSRTPIAVTLLVKNPQQKRKQAEIFYYDIGDYLKREEKLKKIKNFGSVKNIPWQSVVPNEKHDWINQRDGVFDTLIPLAPEKKADTKAESFFVTYAIGLASNRDSWVYNFSRQSVADNMKRMIDFYNEQRLLYHTKTKNIAESEKPDVEDVVSNDAGKISWTRGLRNLVKKNQKLDFDNSEIVTAVYRPFQKQFLCNMDGIIEMPGLSKKLFPEKNISNLLICMTGMASSKDFSCIITDSFPSLDFVDKTQCFPLYYYEENKDLNPTLFSEENNKYIRKDGISDWILNQFKTRFGLSFRNESITKEMIFYYVYGLLHSPQYRQRFASDLKKSLPRIPIVDSVDDFTAFVNAGKKLAQLHLHYEQIPAAPDVVIQSVKPVQYTIQAEPVLLSYGELLAAEQEHKVGDYDEYEYYRVEKMRFAAKGYKDTIIYNRYITLSGIPEKAYEYVINGKSAIEWIMERYAVKTDKGSGIKNDPNLWGREHNQPRYILDLLLSVINVSMQTVDIVASLPPLEVE